MVVLRTVRTCRTVPRHCHWLPLPCLFCKIKTLLPTRKMFSWADRPLSHGLRQVLDFYKNKRTPRSTRIGK